MKWCGTSYCCSRSLIPSCSHSIRLFAAAPTRRPTHATLLAADPLGISTRRHARLGGSGCAAVARMKISEAGALTVTMSTSTVSLGLWTWSALDSVAAMPPRLSSVGFTNDTAWPLVSDTTARTRLQVRLFSSNSSGNGSTQVPAHTAGCQTAGIAYSLHPVEALSLIPDGAG